MNAAAQRRLERRDEIVRAFCRGARSVPGCSIKVRAGAAETDMSRANVLHYFSTLDELQMTAFDSLPGLIARNLVALEDAYDLYPLAGDPTPREECRASLRSYAELGLELESGAGAAASELNRSAGPVDAREPKTR